jgi:predicted metal-dependent peptidase
MQEAIKKLEKATVDLIRHPETSAYAGVLVMGKTTVVDNVPTACTDGVNERYGEAFLNSLMLPEVRGLKLHEGLHKVFKHTVRGLPYWKKNPKLANIAADYVVNDVIMNIKDKEFIKLPKGGLYDPKFHNWSFPEIYRVLEQEEEQGGGGGGGGGTGRGEPLDEHDMSNAEQMSAEEMKEYVEQVNEAIHQGGLLASRFGQKLPRSITETLQPQVDWTTALREFVSSIAQGNDDHTYRKFDKRLIIDDIINPGVISEKVGDIVVAIDTSGSIGGAVLNEFATELQALCEQVSPDALRVMWWDTKVRSEQVFTPEMFNDITKLLKPAGGGGTEVSCVSSYMVERNYKADCMIVFTDGYVEDDVRWDVMCPTLWLVTSNRGFVPPRGGKMVKVEEV